MRAALTARPARTRIDAERARTVAGATVFGVDVVVVAPDTGTTVVTGAAVTAGAAVVTGGSVVVASVTKEEAAEFVTVPACDVTILNHCAVDASIPARAAVSVRTE